MNNYTKSAVVKFLSKYGKMPMADFGGGRKTTKHWEYITFPKLGITQWEIYDLEGGTKTLDLVKETVQEKFNTIICIDVLEHVRDPFAVARNIENALNLGGYALIIAPFIYKRHGQDYFRYTEEGLKALFNNVKFISEENYKKRIDCEHSAIIIKKCQI